MHAGQVALTAGNDDKVLSAGVTEVLGGGGEERSPWALVLSGC